jgi:hypothetical protein
MAKWKYTLALLFSFQIYYDVSYKPHALATLRPELSGLIPIG